MENSKEKAAVCIEFNVDYPFIYFLRDHRIVFVYEITSKKAINAEVLFNSDRFRAIEMSEEEAFETFKHGGRMTPEGTSFFMKEDELAKLVEQINRVIEDY
ncbi:hypothetical protein BN1080_02393 [Planococcus massiliensis]|uniref:Uncharacterized protein n=1 Tax=Planococcus massiliensis TaxID=1499687 RepID=A0A098ENQ9_9BACL|nr:hypothetical protein [Planococcus massiliensis]CEG23417.1 hypothetical protein BN1080_02393 [Planococcus massiliensis]